MADPTEGSESEQHGDSAVLKELRAKAKRVDAAEARAAELEREIAFHKADLAGLSDKQRKALLAAHDGEIEPEALAATATELGFQAKPAPAGETTEQQNGETAPEGTETDGELAHLSNFAGAAPPEGREQLTQAKVDEMIRNVPAEELDDWMYQNQHLFGIQG